MPAKQNFRRMTNNYFNARDSPKCYKLIFFIYFLTFLKKMKEPKWFPKNKFVRFLLWALSIWAIFFVVSESVEESNVKQKAKEAEREANMEIKSISLLQKKLAENEITAEEWAKKHKFEIKGKVDKIKEVWGDPMIILQTKDLEDWEIDFDNTFYLYFKNEDDVMRLKKGQIRSFVCHFESNSVGITSLDNCQIK